jgi:hypothetical protein
MDRERLIELHPVLYHMADARNWSGIRRHGLLSTTALLDLFGVAGAERAAVEAAHRPASVRLPRGDPHPEHGHAYVRDQRPLEPEALAVSLDGMLAEEWLRLLNGRVYFWPTPDRLERMLRSYPRDEQAIFEIDTRRLLERHGDRVELSHINSGFASSAYRPVIRGRHTFVPLADYAYSARNTIAELTVPYAVPDVFDLTTRVTARRRGRPDRVLWEA